MACVRRLQDFSMKLGYQLCLIDRYCVSKHCITSRKIYLSACHGKVPRGNPNDETEDASDLDFFGLNESSGTSSKKFSEKIHMSDKLYINELIEKHSAPSRPENVQLKSFGSIRYDRHIPERENTKTTKISRNERRTNNAKQQSSIDGSPSSFSNHFEPGISDSKMKKSDVQNMSLSAPEHRSSDRNLSFVDEQYFSYDGIFETNPLKQKNLQSNTFQVSDRQPTEQSLGKKSNKKILGDVGKTEQDMSLFDEQYFGYNSSIKSNTSEVQDSSSIDNFVSSKKAKEYVSSIRKKGVGKVKEPMQKIDKNENMKEVSYENSEQNLSYIDKQFFSYNGQPNRMPETKQLDHSSNYEKQTEPQFISERNSEFQENEPGGTRVANVKPRNWKDTTKGSSKLNQQKDSLEEIPLIQKKQTAYDASMKIRTKFEQERASNLIGKFNPRKYDSKGFRILADQVPHFDNAPSIDVVNVLRKSIIYDQNDILAISKPYGLPSHDGPGVFHSVGNLLDQIVPKTQLYPVHRLDKETTGVMLFAKSEEMADRLSECFLKREVTKKYLVITKNIPELQTGEIDIPVAEGTVEGKARMCLRPYYSPELSAVMKKRQEGTKAVTRYRVLDMGNKCAVLECIPVTGKKHQIRVHLAFGLNCPVLGDHKYSHINKLAPMKLHPEILKRLKIQQSKVRYLAMHLHARSITIPEFLNGRNLFILAPLPPHFVRNLEDLKLKLPRNC